MTATAAATTSSEAVAVSCTLGVALGRTADQLTVELVQAALAGGAELGWPARPVGETDDRSGLTALLGIGYQGSFGSILAAASGCRRVAWMGEIVNPTVSEPGPLRRLARSRAMKPLAYPMRPFKRLPLPGPLDRARAVATLERDLGRNLRDVDALAGTVNRIVVTSRDRQAALAERGIASVAVPFGYAAAVAGPITRPEVGDRDIIFASLARVDFRRADRRAIVGEWSAVEPRLRHFDGSWGAPRNELLRRSKIVLNVSRSPGNFVGWRLLLALAAGAVVVSEPMTDPYPFAPGIHYVEAPLDGLLAAARDLEADEPRRRRIASAGQALLEGELAMSRCLSRAIP